MEARSLLLAAVLLLPIGGAAAPVPGPEGEAFGCGGIAPFDHSSCSKCCWQYPGGEPQVDFAILGFVGTISLRLRGDDGSFRATCWSLGAEVGGVTSSCASWFSGEGLRKNERVSLTCWVSPTYGPGLPVAVGPLGPWGCSVQG